MEEDGAEELINVVDDAGTNDDDAETDEHFDGRMDSVEPAMNAVDAVTNARRKDAQHALQFGRQVIESKDDLLDVDTIIRNCVHSAMTMLKDNDACRGRKTLRLQRLLSLLPPEFTEQQGTVFICI